MLDATKCLPESVHTNEVFSDTLDNLAVNSYSANPCKSNHLNSRIILILFPLGPNQNFQILLSSLPILY